MQVRIRLDAVVFTDGDVSVSLPPELQLGPLTRSWTRGEHRRIRGVGKVDGNTAETDGCVIELFRRHTRPGDRN